MRAKLLINQKVKIKKWKFKSEDLRNEIGSEKFSLKIHFRGWANEIHYTRSSAVRYLQRAHTPQAVCLRWASCGKPSVADFRSKTRKPSSGKIFSKSTWKKFNGKTVEEQPFKFIEIVREWRFKSGIPKFRTRLIIIWSISITRTNRNLGESKWEHCSLRNDKLTENFDRMVEKRSIC